MSEYLFLVLLIIIIPLVLSLFPFFDFYRKLPALFFSILTVGGSFIFWDVAATARGHWSFNQLHVGRLHFWGLPLEELLFFLVVPYSCIFLYEGFARYLADRTVAFRREAYLLAAGLLFLLAVWSREREYTALVLAVTGLTLVAGGTFFRGLFSRRIYWLWISACMVLFIVFNLYLTGLPVVIYGRAAITNFRFLTIPIEDFFYNFSLLSWYLGIYLWIKRSYIK